MSKFFVIGSRINRTECATVEEAVAHATKLIGEQHKPGYGSVRYQQRHGVPADATDVSPLYVVQLVKIVDLASPPVVVTDVE